MKKVLIAVLLISSAVMPAGEVVDRLCITLNRFDFDRVQGAKKYFEARMSKTRAAVFGTLGLGAAAVAGYGVYNWHKSTVAGDAESGIAKLSLATDADHAKIKAAYHQQKALKLARESAGTTVKPQGMFERLVERPLKITFWGGMLLIALASGHQIFRVVSGTMEDALQLLWHGYEYWYADYEEQVNRLMNQLREAFYQARKAAQQTNVEQQLLLARQQRRTQAMSFHNRLDIVTLYQRLVSTLERVAALMFIVSPAEHHSLMQQHLMVIQSQIARVAESLECDLNESTQGMLTHYSNNTLDSYHECVESIGIYLSTYRTYLPK